MSQKIETGPITIGDTPGIFIRKEDALRYQAQLKLLLTFANQSRNEKIVGTCKQVKLLKFLLGEAEALPDSPNPPEL